MEGELRSLVKVSLAVWSAMSYARFAASRIRPGLRRLAALVPVLALLPALPFAFSTTAFRGSSAFFLAWLGVFKLLLLAFGRGPLHPSLPLLPFVCSASLPVKLRANDGDDLKKPSSRLPTKLLVSAAVLPFLIYLYRFKSQMNDYQLLTLFSAHIYFSLDVVLAFVAAVINGMLGMEMEPQVNRPYVASSLRDFWGRRWNLMVSAILRPSVYEPVRARLGTAAGVVASFVISGIMHEVMFYYVILKGPTGEVTAFFVLHGVCTAAEGWWARHKGWWRPPRVVSVPVTLVFVAATGFWLFFPVLIRGGLDEMVLEECTGMVALLEAASRKFAGSANYNLRTK